MLDLESIAKEILKIEKEKQNTERREEIVISILARELKKCFLF